MEHGFPFAVFEIPNRGAVQIARGAVFVFDFRFVSDDRDVITRRGQIEIAQGE